VKTAAVVFDKKGGCIEFLINYDYWQTLTKVQKLFVISHECTHLISNHGRRARRIVLKDESDRKKLNVAMDICVNEALISRFGFERIEIDPEDRYIWADKVAVAIKMPDLPKNRCFEYYYSLFKDINPEPFTPPPSGGPPSVGETVDDHQNDADGEDSLGSEVLERMGKEMDEGEKGDLENFLETERNKMRRDIEGLKSLKAGTDPLGHLYNVKSEPVKVKKKWETVIKKWAAKRLKETTKEVEQWAKTSRRYTLMDRTLSLPYDAETDEIVPEKDRIDLWFFLDTSGSCIHLKDRFFKAALSLPKKKFNIKLFCFDTKIYPSDLKSRHVRGGGGTKFHIIEDYIIKNTVEMNKKYPDGVFLITDGAGTPVSPKKPDVWHWFLSQSYLNFVPKASKYYNLKDFE
jgi:predicted metal-dependent peptidase